VLVLSVDREGKRIRLSRERFLPNLGESVTANLEKGDLLKGTVIGLVRYGAFLDTGEGVKGSVRILNSPGGRLAWAGRELGSTTAVQVQDTDRVKCRIWLRMIGEVSQ